jgi:hypothetical protein
MGTIGNLKTAQGIYVSDPTKIINISMASNNSTNFAAMNGKFADGGLNVYIQKLGLKIYKQSIRIIELENKMTKEECANLKAMLESNDEASVILAKEIIDNVEQ